MKLSKLIEPYTKSNYRLLCLKKKHQKLLNRVFWSFGLSTGALLCIFILYVSKLSIHPAIILLGGLSLIDGFIHFILSRSLAGGSLEQAEKEHCTNYNKICEFTECGFYLKNNE